MRLIEARHKKSDRLFHDLNCYRIRTISRRVPGVARDRLHDRYLVCLGLFFQRRFIASVRCAELDSVLLARTGSGELGLCEFLESIEFHHVCVQSCRQRGFVCVVE